MAAMIDTSRLDSVIRNSIEALCRRFFPGGKKVSSEWRIADVTGAEGDSLGIQLTGARSGLWHDRATGQGGNFVQLIMTSRSLGFRDAVEVIEEALGVSLRGILQATTSRLINAPNMPVNTPWSGFSYHMSPEESGRSYEAARRLYGSPDTMREIADWRGLKLETVYSLILDSSLGLEGRNLAFLFETGMKLRPIRGSSHQSRWAFGRPFLWRGWPLVDRSLSDCVREVHIFEGEFDCATALELGIEEEDLSVICVSVPGVNSFRPEWANLFSGKTVTLWMDDDTAGHLGRKRIGELLHRIGVAVLEGDMLAIKGGLIR